MKYHTKTAAFNLLNYAVVGPQYSEAGGKKSSGAKRAHQTVKINSLRPLSSTDGATSISFLFCQSNVLKDDKGGSLESRNSKG